MHAFFLLALTLSSASVSLAECCYAGSDGSCADGTGGVPYCGVGPCNILGCNCDGGCRGPNAELGSLDGQGPAMSDAEHFAAADIDKSGNITLAQFLEAMAADANSQVFAYLFKQHDKNGDGVITLDEVRL